MKYSMDDLFGFMEAGKTVRVTDTDGQVYTGYCWAYGNIQNQEEYGVDEASLEIGPQGKGPHVCLYASEIEKVEFMD